MSRNSTYTDHIYIQALSEMLSCNIHVVNTYIVLGSQADGTHNWCTLVLGYMPDIQHYVSLEPMMRYVVEWLTYVLCRTGLEGAIVVLQYINIKTKWLLKTHHCSTTFSWNRGTNFDALEMCSYNIDVNKISLVVFEREPHDNPIM